MSASQSQYIEKFNQIVKHTVFQQLPNQEQAFIKEKACLLSFTQQELRRVSEIALDRLRWKESPLSKNWPVEHAVSDLRLLKKRNLANLEKQHSQVASKEKSYASFSIKDKPKTQKPLLVNQPKPKLGLGRCPVASEKTRCCNLMTLDAVEKCGFDCSYCSIQSFYHGDKVVFDNNFAQKIKQLKLDKDKIYHIGTGQSSDSLMWGNHNGILEALCQFAADNPNVIVELKTKSRNIKWLLENSIPRNIICTWSLNPQSIIDHEEHLSASLSQRLQAAQAMADKGCVVGFHFHPMMYFSGWQKEYSDIAQQLTTRFSDDQVALVSLGTLTFTKSVMKTIRNRELTSKILQMPMVMCAGKWSYPEEIKVQLFRSLYQQLSAWHKHVFFYLCMEPDEFWQPVFGYRYDSNNQFEEAMKKAYMEKIMQRPMVLEGLKLSSVIN